MENNKILIAIPSKNRVTTLKENTFKWVRNFDYKVFIEPQDVDKYILAGVTDFHILEKNNQGLGYCKEAIKKYAQENGYTHIFKVDDDIKGFTNYRKRVRDNEQIEWIKKIIASCEEAFKDSRVGGIGFPYSFEMYEHSNIWEVTKRLQTAYVIPTELFHGDSKISVFEDFAQGIFILTKGKLLIKHPLAGIIMGVKVGGGIGGHQSFDRFKQAVSELDHLRAIYPPLNYKTVNKPWKIEPDLSSVHLGEKL